RARLAPLRDVRAALGGLPPVPGWCLKPAVVTASRAAPARTRSHAGRGQPFADLSDPGCRRYRGRAAAAPWHGRARRSHGLEGLRGPGRLVRQLPLRTTLVGGREPARPPRARPRAGLSERRG